jgi:putative transposase
MLQRTKYPSCLSDTQWNAIKELIPEAREGGRKRTTDVRLVLDAVFYLVRSGCAWRYLPKIFPPWQTVYWYFAQWSESGTWQRLNAILTQRARMHRGRERYPSAYVIDSQSVRCPFGERRGYDGFKKVRGRKRHIVVDTMGLLHSVKAHAANFHDGTMGFSVLEKVLMPRKPEAIYVDAGYTGQFEMCAQLKLGVAPTITKRMNRGLENRAASNLKPIRWVVERTFAWLNHYRRLNKDYERTTLISESMVYAAMTQLLLRRLSPFFSKTSQTPSGIGIFYKSLVRPIKIINIYNKAAADIPTRRSAILVH